MRKGCPSTNWTNRWNETPSGAEIAGDRNVQALTFSYFTYGYAVYIFFTWFFIYLNSVRGLDMKKSSLYTMLPFIAMAVASPLGGWARSDRITRVKGKLEQAVAFWQPYPWCCAESSFVAGAEVSSVTFAVIVLAGGAGALYSIAELILVCERRYWRFAPRERCLER